MVGTRRPAGPGSGSCAGRARSQRIGWLSLSRPPGAGAEGVRVYILLGQGGRPGSRKVGEVEGRVGVQGVVDRARQASLSHEDEADSSTSAMLFDRRPARRRRTQISCRAGCSVRDGRPSWWSSRRVTT